MSRWDPIPGETPIDPSGLKVLGVTNRRELSLVEAENVAAAVLKYLGRPITRRSAKFDFTWALKLHREMFGNVWDWAGTIRTEETNIGVKPYHAGPDLLQLLEDLAEWDRSWPDRIEQAANLHYRAVTIHPFHNGNGRWSRMLANVWLHLHKHPIIDWPGDVGETSPVRNEYLAALKTADNGDLLPFLELHRRLVRKR